MEYYYEEQVNYDNFDMLDTYSEHSLDTYSEHSAPDAAQSFKVERVSPSPIQKRGRPGRLPARPDEELSPVEFERRERRRERNRYAAARCRVRRLDKVAGLEEQISDLVTTKSQLENQNKLLQMELQRLRFRLNVEKPTPVVTQSSTHTQYQQLETIKTERFPALKALENLNVGQNYSLTFTPLLLDTTFDFPVLPTEAIVQMRNESVTEFNNYNLQVI